MRPSPSIVAADRPSRRLSQPLYDRAPFQISGLTRAGFCCFRECDDVALFDFRTKAVLCGPAPAAPVTQEADLPPSDAIFRDYLLGRSNRAECASAVTGARRLLSLDTVISSA